MMTANKRNLLITLSILPQMLLVRFVALFPEQVEQWYSTGLFPWIAKVFRFSLGWIPFSFGDVMYVVLIVWIIYGLVRLIKSRGRLWKETFLRLGAVLAVVYAMFHVIWGLNYYRLPLHQALAIEDDYTTEDLIQLTERLIAHSNALHQKLAAHDTLAVIFPQEIGAIYERTLNGYKQLETEFPKLEYPPKSLKTSLLSYPLTIMGYSGYLNPITQEAQVNGMIPTHRLPVVSCHEMAHQLGFAKENEANFIGTLASLRNDDLYFQYSGSIFALRYCLSDLYMRDEAAAVRFRESVNTGIFKNYQMTRDFWDRYDNVLEPIFDLFYTNYLEANNQPDGLKTYSYFVALLVNYTKDSPALL